jgi:hypothetical protein
MAWLVLGWLFEINGSAVVVSVWQAEIQAELQGIKMALQHSDKWLLQSNCSVLLQAVKGSHMDRSLLGFIIKEIKLMSQRSRELLLKKTGRIKIGLQIFRKLCSG